MSVVIKDMEMPKNCSECCISFEGSKLAMQGPCYINLDYRPEGCPLSETTFSCELDDALNSMQKMIDMVRVKADMILNYRSELDKYAANWSEDLDEIEEDEV